ncbi:hypothetical protein GLYMA_16G155200v4 [Glycine max]|uniref:START domain-containing protein n=1 Tax=Glycine max TaxID=3847 RepID=K7MHJ6_SOYBN|nr:protein ENHANCED DISEASE RESISTANCE 2 isoform X1 [Glycine max]KAH1151573.1 hypothetical protein GYH30_045197 [Glycine max]KRH08525.1 hypothetical protein GLYMA_16G155200v4 [Glycine max]|eukprot:XP_006599998.2 protein ENHANCED DISEASE RESISTANCE 2 [Glycine max]
MAAPHSEGVMEGWLYIFASNRIGLHCSRKRYFILKESFLRSFKDKPVSLMKEPNRSAIIDSSVRVIDNGRETINKKVFFTFTVYNASNQIDQLKLGASSSEEAAKWIRLLKDAALKENSNSELNLVNTSKKKHSSLRMGGSKRTNWKHYVEWNFQSCIYTEAMISDVIAPSQWKIFSINNGLRMFKEARDWDSHGNKWGTHPVMMAVGVVDGTSEEIFHTLMSLGSSRSEWDFCTYQGSVVDHIDDHTDIIHVKLYNDWLPWGMKPRDFLLRRYWRREDNGTYVLLFHSVYHKICPPQRGYVRASLKSGGFLVTPINKGKQSLVKHMLAIDWKLWKLYLSSSSARFSTIRMLERVAALREFFKAKAGNCSSEPIEIAVDTKNEVTEENSKAVEGVLEGEVDGETSRRTSLMGLDDSDEFFDVSEPKNYDEFENEWHSAPLSEQHSQTDYHPKMSSADGLAKKLQDLSVQKKGYMDLQETSSRDNSEPCPYGATLQKDSSCNLPCSWDESDASLFYIRGKTYLKDKKKVKAERTLMQMVGADWIQSNSRQDDLCSRPGSIVQQYEKNGRPEFFFVVNFQVPGSSLYSIGLYYMMKTPLEDNPLLHSFVHGDDAYRNSRFKLIPYIFKGPWIVKQSVGNKPSLLGKALDIRYIRGRNYLEVDINIGSSTVARGVVNLVLGYLNNLVVGMAFLIQGNTEKELPEVLIGTSQLNHLDTAKAFVVKP